MKINKSILITGAVVILLGLGATMGYEKINDAGNSFVMLEGKANFIKQQMIDRNELIESLKKDIQKYNEGNKSLDLVSKEADKLKTMDEFSVNVDDINNKLVVFGNVNESVDMLIDAYDNNSDMKKDKNLSEKMNEVLEFDYRVDDLIKSFNIVERTEFNNYIDKFPVNIISSSKGWETVNSIESK